MKTEEEIRIKHLKTKIGTFRDKMKCVTPGTYYGDMVIKECREEIKDLQSEVNKLTKGKENE